ncbi:prolyl oligopeptidase family serine peptidase [Silvimonas sp.]|uniref:carboxylesterase family protein n=1 Tax=Silvimonas sp. TaxID=2650811 RepID=UPI00284810B4|nr:prolyl oligopeptidase family serine peptidase [Silvimonas sp.]MDR3427490.1 prolyl oligopeptidase family serine peptidase [Silvimonas sp.]
MTIEHYSHTFSRATLPYLFARPASPSTRAPLVVFLHGAKDRGNDLGKLLAWGFPKFVAAQTALPYYWLALQIPEETTWPDWQAELLGLIDQLALQHAIRPEQVVLSGFSLGSAGAWQIASEHPERFAGLVVVSGRVPQIDLSRLVDTPVRVFHGGQDDKVPPDQSASAVDTLLALGGNAQFTLIPEGDHFIADEVYGNAQLQQWLAQTPRQVAA